MREWCLPVIQLKTYRVVAQDKQNECQPKEIAGNQEDALDYQSISSSLDWIQETEKVLMIVFIM